MKVGVSIGGYMKLKNFLLTFFLILLVSSLSFAGPQEFNKNIFYITPQLGINTFTIPFGANVEYGITPNIGIGGTTMIWLWSNKYASETVIAISAEGAYHFTQLDLDKFDLFAGAGVGIAIYSYNQKSGFDWGDAGASGIFIAPFVGGRYFFNPKIAVCLKIYGYIVSFGTFGATVGVTFGL